MSQWFRFIELLAVGGISDKKTRQHNELLAGEIFIYFVNVRVDLRSIQAFASKTQWRHQFRF